MLSLASKDALLVKWGGGGVRLGFPPLQIINSAISIVVKCTSTNLTFCRQINLIVK